MSSSYNMEAPPTAAVELHTTAGVITLELFGRQTPLATQNFLQHCANEYYDNTVFHRLVPGFIIQGGDPTGTGEGGQSSFENGDPFSDEFHSRLKFNRRGLVGMANGGRRNDNQSQFFITLAPTPELTGRNTLFGRVAMTDDSVYIVMKMSEMELVEGTEKPLYPTRILSTKILDDGGIQLLSRCKLVTDSERNFTRVNKAQVSSTHKPNVKRRNQRRKSGKALVSFNDGLDDVGEEVHLLTKPKFNSRLVYAGNELNDKGALKREVPVSQEEKMGISTSSKSIAVRPRLTRTPASPSMSTVLSHDVTCNDENDALHELSLPPSPLHKGDNQVDDREEKTKQKNQHETRIERENSGINEKAKKRSNDNKKEDFHLMSKKTKLEETLAEIERLKMSMKRDLLHDKQWHDEIVMEDNKQKEEGKTIMVNHSGKSDNLNGIPEDNIFTNMIPETAIRGRIRNRTNQGSISTNIINNTAHCEAKSLEAFYNFKQKLDMVTTTKFNQNILMDDEENHYSSEIDEDGTCDLHFIINCEVCAAWKRNNQYTSKTTTMT